MGPLLACHLVLAVKAMSLRGRMMDRARSSRRRVLPVYIAPGAWPSAPSPIPGSSNKIQYAFTAPSELAFVKDVKRCGSFVHLISEDNNVREGMVGCVVDVALAKVADSGSSGAIVGVCSDFEARCVLEEIVKEFPYAAARVGPWLDDSHIDEDDALSAYDVVEDDDLTTADAVDLARARCVRALNEALSLADSLDPNLGAVDQAYSPRTCGVFAEAQEKLEKAASAAKFDDDAEHRDRVLGFTLLAMCGATSSLVSKCVLTRSASRRYAAIARYLEPLRAELAAVTALKSPEYEPAPPRPAPTNAPPALALLRPGRRLSYWWSDEEQWASASVVGVDPDTPFHYLVDFDGPNTGRPSSLPLAGADRWRWKLLPL